MNRSRILPRIGGVIAAVTLALITLTGCPMAGGENGDDEEEGDDYIHYSLVR